MSKPPTLTPLPGVPHADQRTIVERLLTVYVGGRARRPLWHWMPKGRVVEPARLISLSASEDVALWLYWEGKGLRQASTAQIVAYLEARRPWDDLRLLIFPPDLAWCYATTGEPVDGGDLTDLRFRDLLVVPPTSQDSTRRPG